MSAGNGSLMTPTTTILIRSSCVTAAAGNTHSTDAIHTHLGINFLTPCTSESGAIDRAGYAYVIPARIQVKGHIVSGNRPEYLVRLSVLFVPNTS